MFHISRSGGNGAVFPHLGTPVEARALKAARWRHRYGRAGRYRDSRSNGAPQVQMWRGGPLRLQACGNPSPRLRQMEQSWLRMQQAAPNMCMQQGPPQPWARIRPGVAMMADRAKHSGAHTEPARRSGNQEAQRRGATARKPHLLRAPYCTHRASCASTSATGAWR